MKIFLILSINALLLFVSCQQTSNTNCPSIEECNKCPINDNYCHSICKECYLNTYLTIYFNDLSKCLFEHCTACPTDAFGCKTICSACAFPSNINCNIGGIYSCNNGGKCLKSGQCECNSVFSGIMCEKNASSIFKPEFDLLDVMKNYNRKKTLLGFEYTEGFENIIDKNGKIQYYVTYPYSNANPIPNPRVLVFNEEWVFIKNISFHNVRKIKQIGNELFIVASQRFIKTDINLNILTSIESKGSYYNGLYYDEKNDIFYVIDNGQNKNKIDIFNRNLILIKSINLDVYTPYSINGFKNEIYVGTACCDGIGVVLVLENDIIKTKYDVCFDRFPVKSLIIDKNGYMVFPCFNNRLIRLYHVNGTNMNVHKTLNVYPNSIDIDSKGRLVVTSSYEINIYD